MPCRRILAEKLIGKNSPQFMAPKFPLPFLDPILIETNDRFKVITAVSDNTCPGRNLSVSYRNVLFGFKGGKNLHWSWRQ
jgi:hypothetical protein